MSKIEEKITELGMILPPAPPPGGIYKPVVITGNLLFVSGQPPCRADGTLITGILGEDLTAEEGYDAAKQTALTMLATMKKHLGGFDSVHRLIKVLGMVNSSPHFKDHPQVINGFSDTMREIFGEGLGVGARSAVGMILPGHIAVEVEAIFELR
jgi:enamine deaminase RidA (YjgF/YER057c/UK114 family)